MNYIREINSFYDWLELNELSVSAINLWHALMHINNKAGWITSFTVAESVLTVKTQLNGRTIRNARNELKQKGLIDFKTRKGGKAPIYEIIPFERQRSFFSAENSTESISVEKNPSEFNSAGFSAVVSAGLSAEMVTDHSTLIKHKHKLNKTETNYIDAACSEPILKEAYYDAFGEQATSIQLKKLNSFIVNQGLTVDLVCHGLLMAGERGMKLNYASKTLSSWASKGIKTVDQAQQEQEEYAKQQQVHKQHSKVARLPVRKEIVPEWLNESKKEEQTEHESDEFLNKKQELEQRLKAKYQH